MYWYKVIVQQKYKTKSYRIEVNLITVPRLRRLISGDILRVFKGQVWIEGCYLNLLRISYFKENFAGYRLVDIIYSAKKEINFKQRNVIEAVEA